MHDGADLSPRAAEDVESRAPPRWVPDHEIIRPIGQGAYGEVWLARNVMGTYRAVKVVYRDRFEDSKPYEREYTGIEKYEPVSRRASGLVDILQVGRNDEQGYFYYVMELADDAFAEKSALATDAELSTTSSSRAAINTDCYAPSTLSHMLCDRGFLSARECIAIGLSLARALGFLHENGLVHRDVKPPNIIFIDGIAKLADIGLLTEASDAHTMVGTKGFIAPEGPNSPRGDIYALGKVLYEASTGKDRQRFPEPISQIEEREDVDQLLELNAVILKASEHDPERRYASMHEMGADLELIRSGRSVRRNRIRQRRLTQLTRMACVTLIVTLVAAFGALVFRWNQEDPAEPILTQLKTPADWLQFKPALSRQFDFSPDGRHIALPKDGGIDIWERTSGIIRHVTLECDGWNLLQLRYSRDGLLLAGPAYKPQDPKAPSGSRFWTVLIMNADGSAARQVGEIFEVMISALFWMPDNSGVTVHSPDGRIDIHIDGRVVRRPEVPLVNGMRFSCYSPDGRWIATVKTDKTDGERPNKDIWLIPSTGGPAIQVTRWRGVDTHPAWSLDGRSLYYASSESSVNEESWNIREIRLSGDSGQPMEESRQVTRFVDALAMFPTAIGDGSKLAFVTRTTTTLLCAAIDSPGGPSEPRGVARGGMGTISPDGEAVYFIGESSVQKGFFRVPWAGGTPVRVVQGTAVTLIRSDNGPTYAISPDGGHIAFHGSERGQSAIYSVKSDGGVPKRLAKTSGLDDIVPCWSPDGALLAYAVGSDLFVMRPDGTGRRRISSLYRWQPWTVRWSPDGEFIAAFGYETPAEWDQVVSVFVVSRDGSQTRRVSHGDEADFKEGLSWHPDGDRLTYMRYGPREYDAEHRWAFLDGSPTKPFIDMPGRWDYVGRWAPDGDRYYFYSFGEDEQRLFLKRLATGNITPATEGMGLPVWSKDGKRMLWENPEARQQFWIMEGF